MAMPLSLRSFTQDGLVRFELAGGRRLCSALTRRVAGNYLCILHVLAAPAILRLLSPVAAYRWLFELVCGPNWVR